MHDARARFGASEQGGPCAERNSDRALVARTATAAEVRALLWRDVEEAAQETNILGMDGFDGFHHDRLLPPCLFCLRDSRLKRMGNCMSGHCGETEHRGRIPLVALQAKPCDREGVGGPSD
eukprot:5058685-Pyramimonas_sp.AAC.1